MIAQAAQDAGMAVRALVSEEPRGPNPMPVPCDLHDFTDVSALQGQMVQADVVIDASHGFDGRMSHMGFEAARALALPFLSYARPTWPIDATRDMHAAASVTDALPMMGARVFSATGWASLPEFVAFKGDRLFLRQTTRHDRAAPYDFVQLEFGDPPFDTAAEVDTFKRLGVDTLICRNLGGRASYPKVEAALCLGLRVILLTRPALPEDAVIVTDVQDALAWLTAQ